MLSVSARNFEESGIKGIFFSLINDSPYKPEPNLSKILEGRARRQVIKQLTILEVVPSYYSVNAANELAQSVPVGHS